MKVRIGRCDSNQRNDKPMPITDPDILTSLNPKESDDEVVARLQKMALQAVDHPVWRDFREKAATDHLFWEGEQWTAAEIHELKERHQPTTVFNEIKPIIERTKGQMDELYQTVSFIGRNAPDEAESHVLTDILRWVDQQNDQEFEEGDATLDMLVSGFAVEEINVEDDDDGQPMITERYVDALNHIYPDPYSRHYDWNKDARFVIRASWMDIEDAIAQWPDQRAALEQMMAYNEIFEFAGQPLGIRNDVLSMFIDRERHRIRPAEVWYKRKAKRFKIIDEEGHMVPIGIPLDRKNSNALVKKVQDANLSVEESYVNEMWVGIFAFHALIHHDRSPHRHGLYPFVPLWGWRKKNGGPYGMVRNLISVNEAINKRESKALHLLSNNQVIAETGAVDDPVKFKEAAARPDGFMEVNEGALTGKRIQFRENIDMGSAQLNMHSNAVGAIQRIATATDRDRGLSPEIRSGLGVQRQQRGNNLALSPLIKNMRRSRRLKAKLKLEYIKEYFTEDLVFQVTDDPNAARIVKVPASQLDSIRTKKFDVVIIDDTDYQTSRSEEQAKLGNLLPQLIPLGPAWVKVGVSLSNLREKEGLMKMIDAINQPPPPTPKISLSMDYSNLDPEERATIWVQMGNPELAQQILKDRPDSALLKQIKADLAEIKIKEGTKSMMERGRVDERAAQIALDGVMESKKLEQEALIKAAELQVQQRQQDLDQQSLTKENGG